MLCGAGCRYRDPPSVWICTDIDREYLKYLDTVPLDKMKPGEFHNYAEIASRCRCEVRDE
jgi:hypothetical protein